MSEEHRVPDGITDPLIGLVLADRYRIERRLGEGGMGAVYLARHIVLDKAVALKILHDEYAHRRELVERFLHEAKAASRIRHEHVIDITDFGETATKNVFFAMEYLEGIDLAGELERRTTLEWPLIKEIALQMCSALQAAHEAGVIHRDLKPENIYLIHRQGIDHFVKVLDFGIAKLTEIEEGRRLTRTGMVFGTPEYMSPEQARGEKPDHRVDIYAMGCIIYELCTGFVPYDGDNFMAILTKHLFDPVPQLAARTDRTDLPPGLQDVLNQALEKDREKRFGAMNELAVALDTLDDLPSTPSGVFRRPTRRPATSPIAPAAAAPGPAPKPERLELPKQPAVIVESNEAVTIPPEAAGDDDVAYKPRKKNRALLAGVLAGIVAVGAAIFIVITAGKKSALPDTEANVVAPESQAAVTEPLVSAPVTPVVSEPATMAVSSEPVSEAVSEPVIAIVSEPVSKPVSRPVSKPRSVAAVRSMPVSRPASQRKPPVIADRPPTNTMTSQPAVSPTSEPTSKKRNDLKNPFKK
jgi:eukaryotic-like serine/threonine-protein kinase